MEEEDDDDDDSGGESILLSRDREGAKAFALSQLYSIARTSIICMVIVIVL